MSRGQAWRSGQTGERERDEDHKHRQVLSQRRLWQNNIVCQGPSAGLKLIANVHEGLNHMEAIACVDLFSVRDAPCLAQLVVHTQLLTLVLLAEGVQLDQPRFFE